MRGGSGATYVVYGEQAEFIVVARDEGAREGPSKRTPPVLSKCDMHHCDAVVCEPAPPTT